MGDEYYNGLVAVSDRGGKGVYKRKKKKKKAKKKAPKKPRPLTEAERLARCKPHNYPKLSEEEIERRRQRMRHAREVRNQLEAEGKLRQKVSKTALPETVWTKIQSANIIEFAHMLGFSFEGRPGQELTLRLFHGMGLPEGTLKTFVRVPCEGFVLEERQMSWLEYYQLLTGNKELFEPREEPTEAFLCVGARSGKTTITAIEADYQATRDEWKQYIRENEHAYACVIATNLDQARDLIQQAAGDVLTASNLSDIVQWQGRRAVRLKNGLGIRSFPCNARSPRGFPYFFTAYDEVAWWFTEGPKSDDNIHAAVDPRRMQFPRSKHMEITTPAGKQGRFYRLFSQGAQIHRRLTIKAPTWLFRPELHRLDPEFFAIKWREDPFQFRREYEAEFDEVVQAFLPEKETLECLNLSGDVPPTGSMQYMAGIDASGLSGNDKFGFAICGRDADRSRFILNLIRSWSDKDPNPIANELRTICRAYRVHQVFTDAYAKGWVHAMLRNIGLEPIVCPAPAVVWVNFRKLIIGHNVDMPLGDSLRSGLLKTQASYGVSNRLTITRPRDSHGHGDEAEAAARAVYGASQESYWSSFTTEEEQQMIEQSQKAEDQYDPLTYGRA